MNLKRVVLGGTTLVILLAGMAIERWVHALPRIRLAPFAIPIVSRFSGVAAEGALAASADTLADNDPFRLANEPASVRYDPRADGGPNSTTLFVAAPPPRPTLTLRAIVGGPPWQAIVDGIPGEPSGAVVRQGSVIGKIAVTSVARDSVSLRGLDTTWVLTFRERP